ncbi:MAG: AbrB/MazE/SpoVT family DNA-binding domain-containing protein [Micropruina sp.]|uniref:AbrB/MazE/SpoVT family DNA-binding domain-containing protein n=1 Tax=Micropruina sp. TaxID=2737536 RepID=UPI0039E6194F
MKTTIDSAGRVVIPKSLRQQIGLAPGEVEITVDGDALRLTSGAGLGLDDLPLVDGIPTLPPTGAAVTADDIRELRLADQR